MTIASILANKGSDVVHARADMRVAEVVRLLAGRRIGAVPVLDDAGGVLGILSERDILYQLAEDGPAMLERTADTVMTAPAVTVEPQMAIIVALSLMTRRRIRHLPVVEAGRMIGFVSIGDLVKARVDRIESEAAAMRDYITAT
ncbi:MAG: CBS domain-containing protein [Sphingomonas sp.]